MKWLEKSGWYGLDTMVIIKWPVKDEEYRVLVLGNRKTNLVILEKLIFDSIDDLKNWVERYPLVPIFLDLSEEASVEKLIPNEAQDIVTSVMGVSVEKRNQFQTQILPGKDDQNLGAIMRKQNLENIYTHISPNRIIYINLTDSIELFLLPIFGDPSQSEAWQIDGLKSSLEWNNGLQNKSGFAQIISREELAEKFELTEEWLSLFATGVFFSMIGHLIMDNPEVEANKNRFKKIGKSTKVIGYGAVLACLILLFSIGSNFWLKNQRSQLEANFVENQHLIDEMNENQQQIDQLKEYLGEMDKSKARFGQLSFLLDQIAAEIPLSIKLEKLYFQPDEEKLHKLDRRIKSLKPDLVLKGESIHSAAISNLAIQIHKLPMIEEASLFSNEYQYETGLHQFILILKLKSS